MRDYEAIARAFNPKSDPGGGDDPTTPTNAEVEFHKGQIGEDSTTPPGGAAALDCGKSGKSGIRVQPADKQAINASVAEYMALQDLSRTALGIVEDLPGDYDHKATIAGGTPPLVAVQALQAWLATVDWQSGLRCGQDGHQCRVCKGIPCQGSVSWPQL